MALKINQDINILDKEYIKSHLPCTITNLMDIVSKALQSMGDVMKQLEKEDISLILAVGNTGCGKSTMLSSLIDGAESLQKVEHEFKIEVRSRDGAMEERMKKKNVIE